MLRIEHESFITIPDQVPDGPKIVHGVARRANLAVRPVVCDREKVSAANLERRVAQFSIAVSVGWCESVVIDLRLRMGMGRVGAPASRKINHFPEYQVA